MSFVDGRDVAALAAKVLEGEAHSGNAYTLTGPEALTHHEVAEIISEATGRTVGYEPIAEEAMEAMLAEAGWPQGRADTFARLLAAIREGRRLGLTARPTPSGARWWSPLPAPSDATALW